MDALWRDHVFPNVLVFLLAVALDRLLPEPPQTVHPVVWMGRTVSVLQRVAPNAPASAFLYGCAIVVLVVGISAAFSWLLVGLLRTLGPVAYVVGSTLMLRTTFMVRGLTMAATVTRRSLEEGNLDEARASLRSLASRDTGSLEAPSVAASAIESVAENSTDSYVGPWLAFALLGVPGAMAYRAMNTLVSMIGYRGPFEYLGKSAALLDDVINLVPARLSALLLLAGGALCGSSAGRGWRVMMRDCGRTASPNSGHTMSALAGLLGTQLEKPGHYQLGIGLRDPQASDIGRAVRIAELTALLAVFVTMGLLVASIVAFN